jgi:hypothetical protein
MTRRIYTYDAATGWGPMNLLATAGALLLAVSLLVFVGNVWRSARRGAVAAANPWGGSTLEWATTSPPRAYNFEQPLVVQSLHPLWDHKDQAGLSRVVGLPTALRTMLVTRLHDADPDHITVDPSPSIWPFFSALAVTVMFIGSIFTPWALVWGAIPVTIGLIGWFWPNAEEVARHCEAERKPAPGQAAFVRVIEQSP